MGISTDSIATHERWLEASPAQGGLGELNFPLAADEDGAACRAYGLYLERQHVALRGLFLIDPNGVLGANGNQLLGIPGSQPIAGASSIVIGGDFANIGSAASDRKCSTSPEPNTTSTAPCTPAMPRIASATPLRCQSPPTKRQISASTGRPS